MLTGGISAAGTGAATVCSTQLIVAVCWTVDAAGGVLSPRIDPDISRLTCAHICLNGPAQKVVSSIPTHANVKHAVADKRCWIHVLVTEAEGAVSCLNHLTLNSGGLIVSAAWTGGATAITAGVVAWYFPGCPKSIRCGDCCSIRGVEIIIRIVVEISTKSTHVPSVIWRYRDRHRAPSIIHDA